MHAFYQVETDFYSCKCYCSNIHYKWTM